MVLRHVDLCSGIGGFALGFEWAGLSRPVMFCDIEPWSRKILAKHWPDVPIEEDVKVLANEPERIPECSILTAGYPCQPFSQAGKRRGAEDDRHIWPYIREIVAQKRPAWCVFENVYGHVSMGLDQVLLDMEADGYATRPFIVPACGVDASHRRDRVWIVGYSDSQQWRATKEDRGLDLDRSVLDQRQGREETDTAKRSGGNVAHTRREHGSEGNATELDKEQTEWASRTIHSQSSRERQSDVADTNSIRQKWRTKEQVSGVSDREGKPLRSGAPIGNVWATEPSVGRVAHGIPRRVDRLKGLGNAIVPQIAMQIGLTIKDCHEAMGG